MGRYLHLQGEVYYRLRGLTGPTGPLIFLGNTKSCSIETETEIIEHLESMSGQRIMDNRYQFGFKMRCNLEFDEYRPETLALALKGETTAIAAGSATGESVPTPMPAGGYYRTRFGSISGVSFSSSLTAGTDYVIVDAASGLIRFLTAQTGTLTISYSYAAQTRIAAVNDTTPPELWLEVHGKNVAAQSRRLVVTIYRFAYNAVSALALLSDDPTMFRLEGAVLRDTGVAADVSDPNYAIFGQYMNVLEVE